MLPPNNAETDNGDGSPGDAFATEQRRQDDKSEGEAAGLDDLLTLSAPDASELAGLLAQFDAAGLDLDGLAAELRRRLTNEQRRRLAELLTANPKRERGSQ